MVGHGKGKEGSAGLSPAVNNKDLSVIGKKKKKRFLIDFSFLSFGLITKAANR